MKSLIGLVTNYQTTKKSLIQKMNVIKKNSSEFTTFYNEDCSALELTGICKIKYGCVTIVLSILIIT